MSHKVYIDLAITTKLIIDMEEDVEVSEVIQDMDFNFISETEGAEILSSDTKITVWNVVDSK